MTWYTEEQVRDVITDPNTTTDIKVFLIRDIIEDHGIEKYNEGWQEGYDDHQEEGRL